MKIKGTYTPSGVCSKRIDYVLEDGLIKKIHFTGGCNGNLSGISKLVVGMPAEKVLSILKGTRCGNKATSCPDQLAKALAQELEKLD